MPIMMIISMPGAGFLKLIPIDHLGFHVASVIFIITISAILGGVLMGYPLAPLFLIIHKSLIGRKMIYGIQNRPEPEKFKGNFKAFFPALIAINIALIFNSNLVLKNVIVSESYLSSPGGENIWPLVVFFMVLIITTGIGMALFSPVWFLLDAGIVYTNKKKVKDKSNPIELHSVGGWYKGFLKGYAGISVFFTFFTFAIQIFTEIEQDALLQTITILPFVPFLVVMWSLPAIVIFDMIKERRKKYILNYAKKLGILEEIDIKIIEKA